MNPLYIAGGLSILANIALTGLYLDKRDDLAREIEACNTRVVESVARSEKIAREATEKALTARMAQLEAMAKSETKAREIAEESARMAESRPPKVRTVIKEISSANACLNTDMPAVLVDRVFE